MAEIVGACVSQFHGDENSFEFLLAYEDGREIGHSVSRDVARRIASEIMQAVDDAGATAPDLLQALLPFAKVYEKDISVDEDDADLFQVMLSHNRAPKLTVGDFRRAFQAVFEAEGRS